MKTWREGPHAVRWCQLGVGRRLGRDEGVRTCAGWWRGGTRLCTSAAVDVLHNVAVVTEVSLIVSWLPLDLALMGAQVSCWLVAVVPEASHAVSPLP